MSSLTLPRDPSLVDPHAAYLTDAIGDLVNQTMKFLDHPAVVLKDCRDDYDRYLLAFNNACGVHGIRYDADRVQSTPRPHDDALAALADLSNRYEKAYQDYLDAYHTVNDALLAAGLNRAQYICVWYRHLADRVYSYDEISKMISKKYSMDAFRIYKKAFSIVSRYLEAQGIITAPPYVPDPSLADPKPLDDETVMHDYSSFVPEEGDAHE